ncbi:MAG: NADP-reducing hydrogenase subunit HndC [bacterium ADurb.Bin243]|nr:MAG: NADP-reducing hydrogenase subunit HndC [bacterium ADurb.Bin243]HOD38975.1 NADH-ubiquinone oxidoreductase-F iron-sulfur binding region domain-containing protein [Candidatus Wallbacteria bacterium]
MSKVKVYIGMGTCGLAQGALEIKKTIEDFLDTRKINFEIVPVGCIGYCSREVMVDFEFESMPRISYCEITPQNTVEFLIELIDNKNYSNKWLLGTYKKSPNLVCLYETPYFVKQKRVALENCGIINPYSIDEYSAVHGFVALKKVLSAMKPEDVIDEIKKSGLRGRGGGGFPTAIKWELAFKQPGTKKYIVMNADEGDPGAFMDRAILESDPFRVIEGITIGAYATGASAGYIYARAEYPLAIERLENAIKICKEKGYLGKNIMNSKFSFDLKVKKGAGAFVCGEETALLASIEGKRGMPTPRPPYPAEKGLFGKPTVINNVETFANVPWILREGSDKFAAYGVGNSRGTKVFAVTGRVKYSGLIEVPMGITLKELIYDIAGGVPEGRKFKAVQIGGPSGACMPEKLMDTKITYEELKANGAMMGSGGMVVMDDTTCMVDVARFFMNFIQTESCGKCIPCREGTKRLYEILDRIVLNTSNQKKSSDELLRFKGVLELEELCSVIKNSSLCGLGQTASNPVLSTLKHFRDEYEAHIFEKKCPTHVCSSMVKCSIISEKCKGCSLCARKCPHGAIYGKPGSPYLIAADKCTGCLVCISTCKFSAIVKE